LTILTIRQVTAGTVDSVPRREGRGELGADRRRPRCERGAGQAGLREWAEGQHNLWTGKCGGEPGRSGLDDAGYAEALRRLEPGRDAAG
jgi:hypothetical protein